MWALGKILIKLTIADISIKPFHHKSLGTKAYTIAEDIYSCVVNSQLREDSRNFAVFKLSYATKHHFALGRSEERRGGKEC